MKTTVKPNGEIELEEITPTQEELDKLKNKGRDDCFARSRTRKAGTTPGNRKSFPLIRL
ncbi:MAG: hypothetical protein R3C11_07105 [Planctomycetaceae bacterium]